MKEVVKDNTNFALIVVGIVALVGIIGMLKFNDITAKATGESSTSRILTESNEIVYCNPYDCKEVCGKECIGVKTRAGAGVSQIYCAHNLYYDSEGTYYMHYFCG